MSNPAPRAPAGTDLDALNAITDAVESGAGLPEVVRAAARAIDASVAVVDRAGGVLAVAARSPADERGLLAGVDGVERADLRVADERVGQLRWRQPSGAGPPSPAILRIVTTLIASEVERVRAPARASADAVAGLLGDVFARRVADREELAARADALGLDLAGGASIVVVHARVLVPAEEGWRERVVAVAARGARAVVSSAVAAVIARAEAPYAEVAVLLPSGDEQAAARACDAILQELRGALVGHAFALGRSRPAADAGELVRASEEARLAANVAESSVDRGQGEDCVLAFDETGAYRLLLSAMSEDPEELQRFYAETIEPLAAYDEQYDTDLVTTVEAFLGADGNVAGTAQRLFTHRHTIRYRLERVRELTGLDVGSTDGRERLSLGLKAMRVLGMTARGRPAAEAAAPRRGEGRGRG